jgi:hypothetical protein
MERHGLEFLQKCFVLACPVLLFQNITHWVINEDLFLTVLDSGKAKVKGLASGRGLIAAWPKAEGKTMWRARDWGRGTNASFHHQEPTPRIMNPLPW